MLYDDDWCGCKFPSCDQQWTLDLKRGWIPMGHDTLGSAKPKYFKPKAKTKVKATTGSLGSRRPRRISV